MADERPGAERRSLSHKVGDGINKGPRLWVFACAVVASVAFCCSALAADGPEERFDLNIEATDLGAAMEALIAQTDVQLLYPYQLAEMTGLNPVHGRHTLREALDIIFERSGFSVGITEKGTVAVFFVEERTGEGSMKQANLKKSLLAGAAAFLYGTGAYAQDVETIDDRDAGEQTEERERDTIVVTGTNIRGFAPESSPLDVYTREDILNSGVTSTEQFIRLLPQNFGGGSSEFAANGLPNDSSAGANQSFGTSANLRGLGSESTLVLLNGNRLAPTSTLGDYVDLSMIPVSALERVDVLTDGASSVYGGDAVAGVINFVLRDDYEGAETSVRYGTVTDGELDEYRVSQTLGTGWKSGNILGTYEYFRRDNLSLADRPNIAAPALISGEEITDISLFDLLPAQERHSAVVSIDQNIAPSLEFTASALYSNRRAEGSSVNNVGTGTFTNSNTSSESIALNAGVDYEIGNTWAVSFDGTYSTIRNNDNYVAVGFDNDNIAYEFDADLWSISLVVNGEIFDLPGGPVKVAFGGQYRSEDFIFSTAEDGIIREGDRNISAAFGEVHLPLVGPQNSIPGIERLEINASGRLDDYSDFGTTLNPKVGMLWIPIQGLKLRGSYSTSFAPPSLGQVGSRGINANVLPMQFLVDVFGLGGQYPSLESGNYMAVTGTDNLGPETSRTITAGADYSANWGSSNWSLTLNYYDIVFEGRPGRVPIPGNVDPAFAPFLAFDDPSLFPEGTLVLFPTENEVSALVDMLEMPPRLVLGGTLDNVIAINKTRILQNLESTETRGLDFHINYDVETGFGQISAGFNANYIIDFTQQATSSTPEVQVLNSLYNPVDLKLRGRLGISSGGFVGNMFVNYIDSYDTDDTDNAVGVDSWTTIDLSLSYAFESSGNSILKNAALNLSVLNLFDTPPPTTPALGGFQIAGYDPTNASPLGRFIALELRKAF